MSKENEIKIMISYVEIYNENIYDLLIPKENNNYLDLRDNPMKGVILTGAT